jgi:shikimate dehydrogenase
LKLCYLVGYPVAHSVSPAMHNAAFRHLGLSYEYQPRAVEPGRLEEFIEGGLRSPSVRGANVTIPHKVEVVRLMDKLDETAEAVGAVNTIVNDDGSLTGYNTDGLGAVRALEETYGDLRGRRVILIGAGGAARAVAHRLVGLVGELIILNRDEVRAADLKESVKRFGGASVKSGGILDLANVVGYSDILINATSVGMKPDTVFTPVDPKLLHPGLLVFDLIYNPPRTRLLADAEAAGAKTLGGADMLVYQGAEAFRLWTGVKPPEALMMRVVKQMLGVVPR